MQPSQEFVESLNSPHNSIPIISSFNRNNEEKKENKKETLEKVVTMEVRLINNKAKGDFYLFWKEFLESFRKQKIYEESRKYFN